MSAVSVPMPVPFTYRWQKNGVDLVEGGRYAGTTNSTLFVGPIAAAGSNHRRSRSLR